MKLKKGEPVEMEVVIGEFGGLFHAYLLVEQEGKEYKNMVKGSLKVLGEATSEEDTKLDVKEETIDDGVKEESVKDEPSSNPKTDWQNKEEYWEKKFAYEVERDPIRQQSIVRQSSWDKANKYMENVLKAVELKVEGVKVEKSDLEIKSIQALAHVIEKDILRK